MIELILLTFFGSVAVAAGGSGLIAYQARKRPILEARVADFQALAPSKKPIPASVQAEIDRTPEWWDGLFHKALERTGARVIAQTEPEEYDEYNYDGNIILSVSRPPRYALQGCSCSECARVLRETGHSVAVDKFKRTR